MSFLVCVNLGYPNFPTWPNASGCRFRTRITAVREEKSNSTFAHKHVLDRCTDLVKVLLEATNMFYLDAAVDSWLNIKVYHWDLTKPRSAISPAIYASVNILLTARELSFFADIVHSLFVSPDSCSIRMCSDDRFSPHAG